MTRHENKRELHYDTSCDQASFTETPAPHHCLPLSGLIPTAELSGYFSLPIISPQNMKCKQLFQLKGY